MKRHVFSALTTLRVPSIGPYNKGASLYGLTESRIHFKAKPTQDKQKIMFMLDLFEHSQERT